MMLSNFFPWEKSWFAAEKNPYEREGGEFLLVRRGVYHRQLLLRARVSGKVLPPQCVR